MTMAEWDNKRQYTNADGVLLTVVMVKEHKTSVAGCCKCVLTTVDVDRVNVYIRSVRPQQIEDHDHPFVLALVGGKQYDEFTQRAKYVFKKFGLKSITPTRARKVAATTAATSRGQCLGSEAPGTLHSDGLKLLSNDIKPTVLRQGVHCPHKVDPTVRGGVF